MHRNIPQRLPSTDFDRRVIRCERASNGCNSRLTSLSLLRLYLLLAKRMQRSQRNLFAAGLKLHTLFLQQLAFAIDGISASPSAVKATNLPISSNYTVSRNRLAR